MKEKSSSDRARESLEAMGLLPYGHANSYRTEILVLAQAVDKDFKTGVTTEERSAFDIFRGGSMMPILLGAHYL